jgi:hypothetical protein
MKEKGEGHHNEILISKQKERKGDMAKLVDATDLIGLIGPWYGNLLSDNFQIQRNPGINKNGQS